MPLLSSLVLAPVFLKTGGATLAACSAPTSFAAGTTAAVGGGAAAVGGKALGIAMLTKGVSSAAKSGAFTKISSTAAAHAAAAPAAAAAVTAAPVAVAAPVVTAAPAVMAAPAVAAAAPATQAAASAISAPAAGAVAAGEAVAAPTSGHGRQFTMVATIVGIMLLRTLVNRYWLNTPAATKSRMVRRVSRWSKEEEVAVEAEEEFGRIPQLPFKDDFRSYVEAGTGAAAPRRDGREEGSRASATRATDAGLTDVETTASTQETRRLRVSYIRRAKGKLHRFL